MYRKGLTVGRIARLCGVVPQTVSRHLRVQRTQLPDIETEHLASRPPVRPLPPGPEWQANIDALVAHLAAHGRYPTRSDPDPANRRLAHWLSVQRRSDRAGKLPEDRRLMLSVLPGWSNNQRSEEAADRWLARLEELKTFRAREGRWPRFRSAVDEAERVLGVWLHGQRQKASRGELRKVERRLLDSNVPGWNTWARREAGAA